MNKQLKRIGNKRMDLTSKHLTGDGINLAFSSFVSTINNPKFFSVGQDKA